MDKPRKTVTLADFLTEEQIGKVAVLRTCEPILKEVILPNIDEINKKLGQENDPKYLAYMCEYVVSMASKENDATR